MVTNSKKSWTQPKLVSLGNDKIKSAMNPTNGFAEYYDLVNCATVAGTDPAQIASLMAACSMNGVSGDSFTYNISVCALTANNPSSWAPGNTTDASTFAFGCCPGASPFGGAYIGGGGTGAVFAPAGATAMAACS